MGSSTSKLPLYLHSNPRLDRWVRFGADGEVLVRSGRVEIGQGVVSAMAQLAADELDVRYERIRMQPADTVEAPDEGTTSGSRSIEEGGAALRQACAEVRDAFLQEAARRLGAGLESLEVDDGTIRVRGGAGALTYWDLAPAVDLARAANGEARPKDAGELRLVGRDLPRLDIPAKVCGGAYVHDIELPGMLHGRIVRPPSYRARLEDVSTAEAEALPGVRAVVREGSFLGVVAEREETAVRAATLLARGARWHEQADLPDAEALAAFLLAQPAEDEVLVDIAGTAGTAATRHEATYTRPYLAHASIGPSCAIAIWDASGLQVWTHSQGIYPLREEIAKVLGLAPASVVVRHGEGAGCYGHNGADDAAFDAVLLARAIPGSPVRVQWMREDEFAWEPYGPAMVVRMAGALDANGRIVDWRHDLWGNRHVCRPGRHPNPGLLAAWHLDRGFEPPPAIDLPLSAGGSAQRNALPIYELPVQRVVNHAVIPAPLRVSTLRALGATANVFAIESFMDELAELAGSDPVSFRLRHLGDARARAVLEAAVERAGWTPGTPGDGSRGTGVGLARYKGSGNYVAVVAVVEIAEAVRATRLVAALDCGRIVSPDGIRNQAEGGAIQAASWALKERLAFDRTRITSRTWEDYPILGFGEVPAVETVLIDRPEEPSLGVGEGMAGPTVAAIANAVRNAMGVRIRDLPITRDRILAAIA